MGRSGSGKGTQAELLRKKFDFFYYISTGDLFRDVAKQDTDVGHRIREILDEGGLPYEDLPVALWMHELIYNLKEEHGILTDGWPRMVPEAKVLDKFLKFLERYDNTLPIYLEISKEVASQRLLARGRYDDNEKAVGGRMDYFDEQTIGVPNYYKEQGRLVTINGEQPPEKIHEDILKAIR